MIWLAVALGASFGAPTRLLVDRAIGKKTGADKPWGTLVINCSGAALLGVFAGLFSRGNLDHLTYEMTGVGFCGAYTTFSTFVWEMLMLVEERRSKVALTYLGLSLVLGCACFACTYLSLH